MVDSVGKKLAEARSAKGLSLDEAAHATKIRPDKLAAIEQDDLSAFPNNTYARGFLLIYGRFLGVDVSDLSSQLQSGNPISVADYQYLNASPEEEPEQRKRMRPRDAQAHRPSIAPLIVFIVLIAGAGIAAFIVLNARRLGPLEKVNQTLAEIATPTPETIAPAATPAVSATTTAIPAKPTPRPPSASDRDFIASPTTAIAPSAAQPTPALRSTPQPAAPQTNELSVEPVKNSWVRIRRDDPASAPVFEGFLYPNSGTLKIKGSKFFVEVRDDGAVNLRKNGQPLAYQAPGITVQ
jgi:cytoskeleton protein RodZ